MNKLKKILYAILGFIALLLIIGLLMPSEIKIEQSMVIDAPIEMVYDQVNNLHNWEKWSPWHKIDPSMQISYSNSGIGKGASYSWTSNHKSVGNGSLSIEDAKPFEYIKTIMDFGESGNGTAGFTFSETENGVKVTWDMYSDLGKGPLLHLMAPLMKKSLNQAYVRGLNDINTECQHLKTTDWYYVTIKEKTGWKYYGISNEKTTMQNMQPLMEEYYGKLYSKLGGKGIQPSGSAFAAYYSWGEEFLMECGVPVEDNSDIINGLESKEFKTITYAVLKHKGAYDGLANAHAYFMKWMETNEVELSVPVIEKYKIGPESGKAPEEWITYILYPVK